VNMSKDKMNRSGAENAEITQKQIRTRLNFEKLPRKERGFATEET
jgi:hypothetical protein